MTPSPLLLPSILSADFARLRDDVLDAVSAAQTSVIHIDVMDGHLVPNISFGAVIIKSLRPVLKELFFDVHLMIDEPVRYAPDMRNAGADNITFHVEAPEVANDLVGAVKAIRALGAKVGVTLKPGTPVDRVLPVIEHVDLVLVMSVEPGFGGQKFMQQQLEKCNVIKPLLKAHQILEIDGGIGPETISLARQAGVDWFVVGSALFNAAHRAEAGAAMRKHIQAVL